MAAAFPNITVPGDPIHPKDYIEKGTGFQQFLAFFMAILGLVVGIVFSYGILLIILVFYPFVAMYLNKKATALIHGSGVAVGEYQFPQIHECLQTFKQRMGVSKDVSVYIVEDRVLNAFSVRYGKKNVILITDDLIQGCLASDNPKALSFVIAHELAHIALGHTGLFRSSLSHAYKRLSRLDEYSCDSVAMALIKEKGPAFTGLLLLTVGWALLPYVDQNSLMRQSEEVALNKYSKKAERPLTHPLLLNRIHKLMNK